MDKKISVPNRNNKNGVKNILLLHTDFTNVSM